MYRLLVFMPGQDASIHAQTIRGAGDVVEAIPKLLEAHPGCECVEVRLGEAVLFAVDCHGQRMNRRR